jgi:hypothetical protein
MKKENYVLLWFFYFQTIILNIFFLLHSWYEWVDKATHLVLHKALRWGHSQKQGNGHGDEVRLAFPQNHFGWGGSDPPCIFGMSQISQPCLKTKVFQKHTHFIIGLCFPM